MLEQLIRIALEGQVGLTRRQLAAEIGKKVGDESLTAMLETMLSGGLIRKVYRGNAYLYSLSADYANAANGEQSPKDNEPPVTSD